MDVTRCRSSIASGVAVSQHVFVQMAETSNTAYDCINWQFINLQIGLNI